MSSEEEAREDVWRTLAEFTERERDDPEIAEIEASLDAYRTAIEQRVLAQQPTRVHLAHDERCETCNDVAAWMAKISRARIARQTQETSG